MRRPSGGQLGMVSTALVRTLLSAAIIVTAAEVAKCNITIGALVASLPLVALMSMMSLCLDTRDAVRVAAYCEGIFWYVLPSLPMFLLIPAMLRAGAPFGYRLVPVSL